MVIVQAKIADVDDLQTRRISSAKNLVREDLSAIESIEGTIEIIDVEMGKEPGYLTVGKTPLKRVHKLLSKLDSIRRSKERGSIVLETEKELSHKFMGQVESIFKNLPKPLEWRSLLNNDLTLLTDIPLNVQTASVKHCLNKAQTKELRKDTPQHQFSTQIKVALMTLIGIPLVRIAQRLNIHRETISKYAQKNQELFNKIHQDFKSGSCIPDIAQKYNAPQPLV